MLLKLMVEFTSRS